MSRHNIEIGDEVELWDGSPMLIEERGRTGVVVDLNDKEAEVDVRLADGTTKRGWFYRDLLAVVT